MLRKGSETTVHAAGFGLAIRGLRPSDTSKAFSTVNGRAPALPFCVSFFRVPPRQLCSPALSCYNNQYDTFIVSHIHLHKKPKGDYP